jgi:hypothetical protein
MDQKRTFFPVANNTTSEILSAIMTGGHRKEERRGRRGREGEGGLCMRKQTATNLISHSKPTKHSSLRYLQDMQSATMILQDSTNLQQNNGQPNKTMDNKTMNTHVSYSPVAHSQRPAYHMIDASERKRSCETAMMIGGGQEKKRYLLGKRSTTWPPWR